MYAQSGVCSELFGCERRNNTTLQPAVLCDTVGGICQDPGRAKMGQYHKFVSGVQCVHAPARPKLSWSSPPPGCPRRLTPALHARFEEGGRRTRLQENFHLRRGRRFRKHGHTKCKETQRDWRRGGEGARLLHKKGKAVIVASCVCVFLTIQKTFS